MEPGTSLLIDAIKLQFNELNTFIQSLTNASVLQKADELQIKTEGLTYVLVALKKGAQ